MKNTLHSPNATVASYEAHVGSVLTRAAHRAIILLALIVVGLPLAQAFPVPHPQTPPPNALSDPRYAKGYLVVTHYVTPAFASHEANATVTTGKIQQAIDDAYETNKILFFEEGIYFINDTLRAHTSTGKPDGAPGYTAPNPRKHLAIVGSTAGNSRPTIKLAAGAAGFSNGSSGATPKPMVEFMNFYIPPANPDPQDPPPTTIPWDKEQAGAGYYQMLRGMKLDCNGNAGATGLYFNQAQDSSIEDVTIDATGAISGIRGLPARASVVVNVEIIGGQFGLDTNGTKNPGTVVVGAVLTNQTVNAVRHDGFVPLVLVGFRISTPPGYRIPAVTLQPTPPTNSGAAQYSAETSGVHLIDGIITLGDEPDIAAIDNITNGRNFYARNVYVSGGNNTSKLVASPSGLTTGSGVSKLIREYSYRDTGIDADPKASQILVDGTTNPSPQVPADIQNNAPTPPIDLVTRHSWASKPSREDTDVVDVSNLADLTGTEIPILPGPVEPGELQDIIDRCSAEKKKIFLPAGVYLLKGAINLRANTILFGADRNLTRIEPDVTFRETQNQVPMITTDNDKNASTYLGDLSIGVFVDAPDGVEPDISKAHPNDRFVALDWQAGRNSMVHIGLVYAQDPKVASPWSPRETTNLHSILRIREWGGGRWYGVGARKNYTAKNNDFHVLKVEGVVEPLWIYGLNLEHARGCDTYAKIVNSTNVRIYGLKSEFVISEHTAWDNAIDSHSPPPSPTWSQLSAVITFRDVQNVALFGSGALRNGLDQSGGAKGLVQFLGNGTDRVLATMIAPQKKSFTFTGPTLLEKLAGASSERSVTFPDLVSLYKRGIITTGGPSNDEGKLTHAGPSYGGPIQKFYSVSGDDGWVRESSETSNIGGTLGNGVTLRVGDHDGNQQYKAILSFVTEPLPDDAVIVSAKLRLRRAGASSSADFTGLGALKVDIRKGGFNTSSALAIGDFEALAHESDVVTGLSVPPGNGDWTEGTLTPAGLLRISQTNTKTQFRVYFSADDNNNGHADYVEFHSGDSPVGSQPVLEVNYRLK